jgi:hypothetical protein
VPSVMTGAGVGRDKRALPKAQCSAKETTMGSGCYHFVVSVSVSVSPS